MSGSKYIRGDIRTSGTLIVLDDTSVGTTAIKKGSNTTAVILDLPSVSANLIGAANGGDSTKNLQVDVSTSTPNTRTTLTAAQTVNRSIALPDANTTLVGTDTIQSISNKTFDSTNSIDAAALSAGSIVNAQISATAGIALSKLAASTPSRALATDSAGLIVPTTTTDIELGYLSGVTSSVQTQLNSKIAATLIGVANGVASLGSTGLIPNSQLPPLAITDTFVVASEAAQIALSAAEVGDVAVRTDLNKSYILKTAPYSTFANWQELLTPTDTILSVNGQVGVVSLTKTDIGLANVDNTSDATKNTAIATLTNKTINGSANTITNISLATGVTGTLPIANGGTGQTTANGALNALLPTQTSQTGKFLQTDGTNTAWIASSGGLAPVETTANVPAAVPNTMYSCTSTGGFTITLPTIPALGAVIGVMDAGETCSATNYIRVAPATGQSIDGYPANDTLTLDYARANAVFYAAPGATSWKVQYQATSMVQGGQLPANSGSAAIDTSYAGSIQSQSRLFAAGLALTTGVTADILATPLTLTAGTYDLEATWGMLGGSGTSISSGSLALSRTSATFPAAATLGVPSSAGEYRTETAIGSVSAVNPIYTSPRVRVDLTSTTTFYLIAQITFSGGSLGAFAYLRAERK